MKNKPSALLVVLLLLIAVIGIWIGNTPNAEIQASAAKNRADRERAANGTPEEDREARARRLSPPAWIPPAVFAGKASPAPQIPFPRGENASRRYLTPKTADLAPNLNSLPPAILANSPEDGRFHLLPDEIDVHTRLARRMVFAPAALDSIVQGNTSRLLAPTIGQEVLTLEFKTVMSRDANTHTFNGHVVGEEATSDVQIVYHDGVIQGNVARYNQSQEIEYRIMADGHMMVRELDQSTMNAPCGNGPETEATEAMIENLSEQGITVTPENESGAVEGDTVGWRHVDVVVGYDQGARAAQGGYAQIEALIIASVDRMTTAFANSLIGNTQLILLGTIEDPAYVYPGGTSGSMSSGDELGDLNNFSNGKLDTVSNYATQLGADFVSFVLTDADGSAGIAYRPGRSSVTARTYMTSTRITFGHELGHNLGCDHSWGDSSQSYHAHYGWRLDTDGSSATTNDRVRTIMAYDWGWGVGARIPYFANPNVSYSGTPTGTVNGHNVQTDLRGDQRYYQGGLGYSGSNTSLGGFNGSNAALGANNSNTINTGAGVSNYGATYASNRATRTAFNVTSPATSAQWARATTQTIFFTGGDEDDLATLQLYKGGVFQTNLAADRNVATGRSFPWAIPTNQASGSDYMIRVSMVRNGSTITADSGTFSIVALISPEIAVEQPVGTNLADGAATINFGSVTTGSPSSAFTFTIRNTGTADLTGLALSKTGTHSADYTLGSLGATTLAPGASTTFDVTFTPGATGARTAALQIASNDSDENPFDIALTGTGLPLGTLSVTAGNFSASGNYGGPFTPSSQVYTLQNTGSTTLNWTAAKTAAWVTLSPTSGTLAAGANTTVTVSLDANALAVGGYNDTVSFTNTTNGSGDTTRSVALTVNPFPVTVNLSGLVQTYDGSPKPVTVSTTPGGKAYSVAYTPSGVPVNAGSYPVTVTITEPNHSGSASGSLTISKASQTISFAALNPVPDNAAPFALTASASSGLPVSYGSSNTNVATVFGNTITIAGPGTTIITASQIGGTNFNAATPVQQTLIVGRSNPLAVAGGPYIVLVDQSVTLNGGASEPSYGATLTDYEWDLNNDNNFSDVTGASPNISYSTLVSSWGMAAGPNTIRLRVRDSANLTSPVVSATLTLVILPLPWEAADIGTGMLAGLTTHDAGTFTQAGSGVIGSTSDKLRFTYQTLTGDGEIIARISSLQNTGTTSRVGVMIRDTLAANSKQIFMGMTGSNSYRWVRRTITGGSTVSTNSMPGTVPNTWVRLVRSGSTITAYKSANGTTWTTVGSTTNTTFASTCYIGLAVGSGSNTTLNTSQFSNVSVTP